jgi:hypothetical protein
MEPASYEGMQRRVRELEAERRGQVAIIAALVRKAGGQVLISGRELAYAEPDAVYAEHKPDGLLLRASDCLAPVAAGHVGDPARALDPRGDGETGRHL